MVLAHAPITPASGGNTPCTCFAKSEPANNPRMRGEYVATTSVLVQGTDNPRTRGEYYSASSPGHRVGR
uniref:Uncharacterized protein n=1 Tax=Klebsiella pneumoniae TaxID=573 RepID=A0A7S5GGN7_KLEPN|nr:hypothetical protein pKpnB199_00050 [Klebsiella pneumoniae]